MKLRITLKSFNSKLINIAINELKMKFLSNNFKILSTVSIPSKTKKFCLLRSPHIDKDSREHFELKILKSFIDIEIKNIKSINDLLNIELSDSISYSINNLGF